MGGGDQSTSMITIKTMSKSVSVSMITDRRRIFVLVKLAGYGSMKAASYQP